MDGFASIGEVSKAHGLTLRTLRFYEEKGLVNPKHKGRQRRYRPEDVERLGEIKKLTAAGFTLKQVSEVVSVEDPGIKKQKTAEFAREVRQGLVDEQEALIARARALELLKRELY